MPKARLQPSARDTVMVVSSKAETLDGLHEYFSQTGVRSLGRSTLNPLAALSGEVAAVVLFPDDFPAREVAAYLASLSAQRPDLLVVVVTSEPPAYAATSASEGRAPGPVVLPRPAFGWTILDAVRSALRRSSRDES